MTTMKISHHVRLHLPKRDQPPYRDAGKGKKQRADPPPPPADKESSSEEEDFQEVPQTPDEQEEPQPYEQEELEPLEQEQPQPRKSGRERKIPVKPGNVYGEQRNPTEILRDHGKMPGWQQQTSGEPSRSRDSPELQTEQDPAPSSDHTPPGDDSPSNGTSEEESSSTDHSDAESAHVAKLAPGRGR